MQLDGLEINSLLIDLKEKEFCLKTGDFARGTEGGINKQEFLRKVDEVCGIEPSRVTRRQLSRDMVFQFAGKFTEQVL